MTPPVTVLVTGRTGAIAAAGKALEGAGFHVLAEPDVQKALTSARVRPPDAMVMEYRVAGQQRRRLEGEPGLRDVPVVAITPGASRTPPPMLFTPLVRASAYLSASQLGQPVAVAAAVREAIARGVVRGWTAPAKLGKALWNVGSALAGAGVALWIAAIVADLASAAWRPGTVPFLALYAAGFVLMDVGGRLARDQRVRLRWISWVWIAVVVLSVVFAAVLQPRR